MDHYSASGGQKRSLCGSHLDFISYWADQTVQEAVLQGQQLRQIKIQSLPTRAQNAVNTDIIKAPVIVKESYSRKKSQKKFNKHRSRSPSFREKSPTRSIPAKKKNKRQKTKTKVPCGMRTAELAVPTKRHCLETWKNKSNILPSFMIERLRQQVMDQRPVVPISDAIYCFKRKCRRRNKNEKNDMKFKKPLQESEVKKLSTIFGHQIAKKLNTPLNIVLNSDLEKMAHVVSYEIADLMCKSKNIDMNDTVNKSIHRDIAEKVTIWVSDVLDESTYKILEDQLRDFEEEAGPVLDFIDDLVNDVLGICIPKPKEFEEPFSYESIVLERKLDEAGLEEAILEPHISSEKNSLEVVSSIENVTHGSKNTEDYIRNAVTEIINKVDVTNTKSDEYLDIDNGPDWQSSEDIEVKKTDAINHEYLEYGGVASEQSDNVKGKDTIVSDNEYLETENDDTDVQPSENAEANYADVQDNVYLETEDNVALQTTKNAEARDPATDITDENLKAEDVQQHKIAEAPLEDIGITELFTHAIEENKDEANPSDEQINDIDNISETLSDENNKKVTFNEMVNSKENEEQKSDVKDLDWKASIDWLDFAEPNIDLLSDADELWPEETLPPIVRPSQSVSKSITSLGKINEDEEKASIQSEEKIKSVETEAQNISDTLRLEITEEIRPSADYPEKHNDKVEDSLSKEQTSIDNSVKPKERQTASIESEKLAFKESEKTKPKQRELRISASKKSKPTETKPTQILKTKKQNIFSKPEKSPRSTKHITKPKNKIKERTSMSTSKEKSQDIESARVSQSSKELSESRDVVDKAIDDKISFLTEKPKLNYRVNVKTAPTWINRNFGEPSCSCIIVNVSSKSKVQSKRSANEVRRWCRDLEQGYENLKMWTEWIDTTSRTVCILQKEINSFDSSKRCTNKEWMKLKRNIDNDAYLWRELHQNTRERLKFCKKMYQKQSEIPSNYNSDFSTQLK